MMRAHRDRRPTVMVWMFSSLCFSWLGYFGICSPYPQISTFANALYVPLSTVGIYIVVLYIDEKAERKDVQRGYMFLTGISLWGIQANTLFITGLKDGLGSFVVSCALMAWQTVSLEVIIPVSKKCFGEDQRKLWSYVVPAFLLALELGPCLVLLGEDLTRWQFWALLMWQELNSVAKNTGKYDELYTAVMAQLGRPVSDEILNVTEEDRATLAPCDNIGEIASPIIVLLVLALEGLYDVLPIERAPYFADANEGILGAWRTRRFRGEAPIMMIIVLVVRLVFCWIELTIRARQRRDNGTGNNNATAELSNAEVSSDECAVGARRRRSSMAVLYNRMVCSQEAPVEVKYMAGVAFALQALMFVIMAATMGKSGD